MNTQGEDVSGLRLRRELLAVLIVKFIVLYGLWFAFFRQPDPTELSVDAVSRNLVGGQAAVVSEFAVLKKGEAQ